MDVPHGAAQRQAGHSDLQKKSDEQENRFDNQELDIVTSVIRVWLAFIANEDYTVAGHQRRPEALVRRPGGVDGGGGQSLVQRHELGTITATAAAATTADAVVVVAAVFLDAEAAVVVARSRINAQRDRNHNQPANIEKC